MNGTYSCDLRQLRVLLFEETAGGGILQTGRVRVCLVVDNREQIADVGSRVEEGAQVRIVPRRCSGGRRRGRDGVLVAAHVHVLVVDELGGRR